MYNNFVRGESMYEELYTVRLKELSDFVPKLLRQEGKVLL